jgi:hypothetical protein
VEKGNFHDMMCYMEPCVACEIKENDKIELKEEQS